MELTGLLLKQLRQLAGYKQETLAKALGISQPAYCELEKSTAVKAEKAKKLLALMNYTPDQVEAAKKLLPQKQDC
jgi:transcriptional regulator with XRE-family HTH domain